MNTQKYPVAFVAHYVEPWNALLTFVKSLHDDPYLAKYWFWMAVYYYPLSIWYKYSGKAFDLVDEYLFREVACKTYLLRNFAWHFISKKYWGTIRDRILTTVLAAQEGGAQIIGLGALVKDHLLTQGGEWVVAMLGDLLLPTTHLTHGDTTTAAVVERQVLELTRRFGMHSPVFVIGASSKIGRALSLSLARRGVQVRMHCDLRRYLEIRNEAEELGIETFNLEHAASLHDGDNCQLWVTGKFAPRGKKLMKSLPRNAVVLNFSVPDPINARALRSRPDVYHLDGGMLEYDLSITSLSFRMRLRTGQNEDGTKYGVTYACHGEALTLGVMGWQLKNSQHDVGKVDVNRMLPMLRLSYKAGFRISRWTSFGRSVDLPELVTQLPAADNMDTQPAERVVGI